MCGGCCGYRTWRCRLCRLFGVCGCVVLRCVLWFVRVYPACLRDRWGCSGRRVSATRLFVGKLGHGNGDQSHIQLPVPSPSTPRWRMYSRAGTGSVVPWPRWGGPRDGHSALSNPGSVDPDNPVSVQWNGWRSGRSHTRGSSWVVSGKRFHLGDIPGVALPDAPDRIGSGEPDRTDEKGTVRAAPATDIEKPLSPSVTGVSSVL